MRAHMFSVRRHASSIMSEVQRPSTILTLVAADDVSVATARGNSGHLTTSVNTVSGNCGNLTLQYLIRAYQCYTVRFGLHAYNIDWPVASRTTSLLTEAPTDVAHNIDRSTELRTTPHTYSG